MNTQRHNWKKAFGKKIITRFFEPSEIDEIFSVVKNIEQEQNRRDYIWKYYEQDKETISRIEYFVNHNRHLNNLANNDRILKEVNFLMGEECVLFKDKINFKYPNGEEFKAHQDVSAGWGNYCNKHITFAIPLGDTTEENGCMYFGKKEDKQLTETFTDLSEDIELKPTYTKKGDVILFDSYIPHASHKNMSSEARTILFFTYTPMSEGSFYEKYHADKFKAVPPDIHKTKGKKYRSGNSNSEEREY